MADGPASNAPACTCGHPVELHRVTLATNDWGLCISAGCTCRAYRFPLSDSATTSGTARQSVPDDGPATPPAGPSSPSDGGVGAPPGPHDPRPDAANATPAPPSQEVDWIAVANEYRAAADNDVFGEWLRLRAERPPRGRYMDAEEAAECFRTIVHDTDPVRRAMALSSLAAVASFAVVSPPVVEQLVDVLRALRDRVPTEPNEDHR